MASAGCRVDERRCGGDASFSREMLLDIAGRLGDFELMRFGSPLSSPTSKVGIWLRVALKEKTKVNAAGKWGEDGEGRMGRGKGHKHAIAN